MDISTINTSFQNLSSATKIIYEDKAVSGLAVSEKIETQTDGYNISDTVQFNVKAVNNSVSDAPIKEISDSKTQQALEQYNSFMINNKLDQQSGFLTLFKM